MINTNVKWRLSAAALAAAAFVAACNNGGGIVPPSAGAPPPPPAQTNDFSVIAERAFAMNANSTPISLDGITFNFDVNDNPGEFDYLIASNTFQ
jgi:hypothetical protein